MSHISIPASQRSRLEALFKRHGYASAPAFASHLVERALGFASFPGPAALRAELEARAERDGYSGVDELVEHLIERGLQAYESPETDRAKLEERLRGLGYID
jgi:hypothetical protein